MISLSALKKDLQPTMLLARERLDARGTRGVTEVLSLALLVAMCATLLAFWGDGYHAGFVQINHLADMSLPDLVWIWITRLGDERLLLVLSIIFARYRPELFWAMIVSALIAILYTRGLKAAVDALRPPAVLAAEQFHLIGPALRGDAFPSGHTATVFVFAGVLFAFADSWSARVLLLATACLVGLSRIALGVHWPHDVLAGAFGGLLAAGLGVWLAYYWRAGLNAGVHLGLMVLPLLGMFLLIEGSHGNPDALILEALVIFAMLAQLMLDYRVYRN